MVMAVQEGLDAAPAAAHQLAIDFMYLDLETCTRCRGTDANLEAALAEVGRVLDAAGVEVPCARRSSPRWSRREPRVHQFADNPRQRYRHRARAAGE